jgi:hypothetical protein
VACLAAGGPARFPHQPGAGLHSLVARSSRERRPRSRHWQGDAASLAATSRWESSMFETVSGRNHPNGRLAGQGKCRIMAA